jgi:hypothetical protein
MASNEITVTVNAEPSEELKTLIRSMVRRELADILQEPDILNALTKDVLPRMVAAIRTQTGARFE